MADRRGSLVPASSGQSTSGHRREEAGISDHEAQGQQTSSWTGVRGAGASR